MTDKPLWRRTGPPGRRPGARVKPAVAGATKGLAGTPDLSSGSSMPRGRPGAVRAAFRVLALVALASLAGLALLVF